MILDLDVHELIDGERRCKLTHQHCLIMRSLVPGRLVTMDAMITAVWPVDEPEDAEGTLKVQICKIRQRIEGAGILPVIGTVWGRGFIARCPIEIAGKDPPIAISARHARIIRGLLETHPSRHAADLALVGLGV